MTYKVNPRHLTADISAETLQARREVVKGKNFKVKVKNFKFKVLKGKNLQPRLLYPARILFKIDGEIKSFSEKQKLREFSTSFTTNVKGTYVVKKYRRRKKIYKIYPKQLRKWQ